jgi:DNA-binding NarL/FixJ family response regulator
MSIRVLVVDNQTLFRQGVKAVFASDSSIEIVAEAADAGEAVQKAVATNPDLVLMEILLSDGDAIEAIRTIRHQCPRTRVLVLTACVNQETFRKAAAAGAIGYVLKDIEPGNLVNAIQAAHSGRTMLSPTIARQLVDHYFAVSAELGGDHGGVVGQVPRLTKHEIDVLAGVAQGLSDKRIAANLFLSEATVKTRLRAIYHKLGLRNRAHAAVFAVENGLLKTSGLAIAVPLLLTLLLR